VDPVPDPTTFFSGSAGNRTRASGPVAKNSDHWTTEAVTLRLNGNVKYSICLICWALHPEDFGGSIIKSSALLYGREG
jgi:hypothetical protein